MADLWLNGLYGFTNDDFAEIAHFVTSTKERINELPKHDDLRVGLELLAHLRHIAWMRGKPVRSFFSDEFLRAASPQAFQHIELKGDQP